jgi:hypothetical protein
VKPAHPDPRISTRGLDVVALSLSLLLRFALVEKAEAAAVDVAEDDAMNSIDDECKPPLFSFLSDADR